MATLRGQLGSVRIGDDEGVAIMGIINLDPNSFYKGSFYASLKNAFSIATQMIENQIDIIDIGGASTAPGVPQVSAKTETRRILALIRRIVRDFDVPISIDTQRASVAQAALAQGASIVNDVSGLKYDSDMADVIKNAGASTIVMAANNRPGDCETLPQIISALTKSLQLAIAYDIPRRQIVIDPGIGFGKPIDCDLGIIMNLRELRKLNQPVLVGVSRKNFIGQVLGYPSPNDRLYGSLAVVTIAVMENVHVIRTHDIVATKDCIKMVQALKSARGCD